jgi:periplasmic mercuric ion binding protein
MNRIAAVTLMLFQLAGPVLASERVTVFAIENMTCALCPFTVEKAMRGVDGVKDVTVNFESKTATVEFEDSETDTGAIAEASLSAGYPAATEK